MFGKKTQRIKELHRELDFLHWDMADVKASNADPDIKSYHLGELQCIEMAIEAEIAELEHKIAMIPLQLMLGGFVIFVIGMTIYMMS
jgi:hypothetical protein